MADLVRLWRCIVNLQPKYWRLKHPSSDQSWELRDAAEGKLFGYSDSFINSPSTRYGQSTFSLRRSGTRRKRYYTGWRKGILASGSITAVVFLINLSLTIWAVTNFTTKQGIGTIITGSCTKTSNWARWLHLAINVTSTILLAASSYCMQCLSSPTRAEVDEAHSEGIWLDIGVPSVRNLWRIKWNRIVLWLLLGLSSAPLHLMYNSVIFGTLSANEYAIFLIPEGFVENQSSSNESQFHLHGGFYAEDLRQLRNLTSDQLHEWNVTNEDCIARYSKKITSGVGNLWAVTSNTNLIGKPVDVASGQIIFTRSCQNPTDCKYGGIAKSNTSSWTYDSQPINYCLSEPVPERCTLQYSLYILIAVVICNAVKVLVMLITFWKQKAETLVTLGDAVASYLDDHDPTTRGQCLSTKRDVTKGLKSRNSGIGLVPGPKEFQPKRHFWFAAPSAKRWLSTIIAACAVIIAAGCLGLRNIDAGTTITSLWDEGFGAANTDSLITLPNVPSAGASGLVSIILIVNSPQVLLSYLYFAYNSLYTSMVMANEWSHYAHDRKSLRVTSPAGKQRSTYYLNLPFTYAIPLAMASGTLHWLVSESIFLVRITTTNVSTGVPTEDGTLTSCGFSRIAIVFTIGVGSLMILGVIANGFRRYKPGIPLAGSNSAAISAACHGPTTDDSASLHPLKWGAVMLPNDQPFSIGHCCFSRVDVRLPIAGQLYAGLDVKDGQKRKLD